MKQFVVSHIKAVHETNDEKLLLDLRCKFLECLHQMGVQDRFKDYCKKMCEPDETFQFWHNFIHIDAFAYVSLYMSIRSANWHLDVASIKLLAPLYHAWDRPTYLRLVARHLSDLLTMPYPLLQHLLLVLIGKYWHLMNFIKVLLI